MLIDIKRIGKSTLINKFLKLIVKKAASTRTRRYVTSKIEPYISNKISYLRQIYTIGIELNVNYGD